MVERLKILYNKFLDYLAKKSDIHSELKKQLKESRKAIDELTLSNTKLEEQLQKEQESGKKTDELYQQSLKSNQESEEKNKQLSKLNQGLERKIQALTEQTNNFKQKYESELQLRTETEKKNKELLSGSEFYDSLFRVSEDIIITLDKDFKIKQLSLAAEDMLDCQKEDLIGKSLEAISDEKECKYFCDRLSELIQTGFYDKMNSKFEIKGKKDIYMADTRIIKTNGADYKEAIIRLEPESSWKRSITAVGKGMSKLLRKEGKMLSIDKIPEHLTLNYVKNNIVKKAVIHVTAIEEYAQVCANLVKTERADDEAIDYLIHYQKQWCKEKPNKIIYIGVSKDIYQKFEEKGILDIIKCVYKRPEKKQKK